MSFHKTKDNKTKDKPEIYSLTCRKRMGADARYKPLTKEGDVIDKFSRIEHAVEWIKRNGQRDNVYVIRNRAGHMVASYCWKESGGHWGRIACDGYLGGYRIGNVPEKCVCELCQIYVGSKEHPSVRCKNDSSETRGD